MHINSLPIISVPPGLANTNTGRWIYDVMPLVSMAACVPTLFLYYKSKRWTDLVSSSSSSSLDVVSVTFALVLQSTHRCAQRSRFCVQAVFSLGFALATAYHVCHMHEEGLQSAALFGISGPLWRTWDIICAQWLLARTFGHAVGARHWVTQGNLTLVCVLT